MMEHPALYLRSFISAFGVSFTPFQLPSLEGESLEGESLEGGPPHPQKVTECSGWEAGLADSLGRIAGRMVRMKD